MSGQQRQRPRGFAAGIIATTAAMLEATKHAPGLMEHMLPRQARRLFRLRGGAVGYQSRVWDRMGRKSSRKRKLANARTSRSHKRRKASQRKRGGRRAQFRRVA